jgi:hypothetical protein
MPKNMDDAVKRDLPTTNLQLERFEPAILGD